MPSGQQAIFNPAINVNFKACQWRLFRLQPILLSIILAGTTQLCGAESELQPTKSPAITVQTTFRSGTDSFHSLSRPALQSPGMQFKADEGAAGANKLQSSDFEIPAGTTVVPFRLMANFIVVTVWLSNKKVSLMLDSGAVNFISPALARKLGLKVKGNYLSYGAGNKSVTGGATIIPSVRIGNLVLRNQKFYAVPLPYALMHLVRPEIVGGIGYQVLRQLPVRVDYVHQTLTFYGGQDALLHHTDKGIKVSFFLYGQTPVIHGNIDGVSGLFQIDTGFDGALSLSAPFVARNQLMQKYSPRLSGFAGEGVGGREIAYFTRADTLTIGFNLFVHSLVAELLEDKGGMGADSELAGNIGARILKQFDVTFDYPHRVIYFAENANYGKPESFNLTGLAPRITPEGLKVMSVFDDSPASDAGVSPGDIILSINGRSGRDLDAAFLWKALWRTPGTILHLKILHNGKNKQIQLKLRELL